MAAERPLPDLFDLADRTAVVTGGTHDIGRASTPTSPHGLTGPTKSLVLDWASDVWVSARAPGYVSTDLTKDLEANDRVRESAVDRRPMVCIADPSR